MWCTDASAAVLRCCEERRACVGTTSAFNSCTRCPMSCQWPSIRRHPERVDASVVGRSVALPAIGVEPHKDGSGECGAEEVGVLGAQEVFGDRVAALLEAHDSVLDHPQFTGEFFRRGATAR